MRIQNLLKTIVAILFALSGYFVRGWYEKVNSSIEIFQDDRVNLMVLTNEVHHLIDNQTKMLQQLKEMNSKLDDIKRFK